MIDVHAPEHGIHNVREFFLHLFTITCGLLIALGLEAGVEAVHHRHQREQAERMIRQELQDNRADVVKMQSTLNGEMGDLVNVLAYIDARLAHRPADASKLRLQYSEGPLKDAAWRTAAATGVVAYMDYESAETYAECYKQQEEFERLENRAIEAYLDMEYFSATKPPAQLSDEELKAAQPVVRKTLADLGGLRDVARGTVETYDAALK